MHKTYLNNTSNLRGFPVCPYGFKMSRKMIYFIQKYHYLSNFMCKCLSTFFYGSFTLAKEPAQAQSECQVFNSFDLFSISHLLNIDMPIAF